MVDATPPNDATLRQITAARPDRSTWLTANAGSGKTRVLTDRVARLLLEGTAPERVLCLTYTKAAATEMQNRLLARLGEWAMLPDGKLRAALAKLGVEDQPDLGAARRLFAQAIETPGGLKVQTIHSFCAALLRRFPLEAGVPHGFSELDDRSATLLRAEILDEMAEEGAPEMADLTAINSGDDVDRLLGQLTRGADLGADSATLWQLAGLAEGFDEAALVGGVFAGDERRWIGDLITALATGSTMDQRLGETMARVNWDTPGMDDLALLEGSLLFGATAKLPYGAKIGTIPTKKSREGACAPFLDDLEALMARVEAARPDRVALAFVQKSAALHRFGRAFVGRYQERKVAAGWLDFDDLITRAAALLSDASMAQWVLFRLDGGIDHILVDEAQDTSPEQWRVIELLAAEFTAGASDRNRTLFVVGDPKQSIYSFQGADIAVFEARRAEFVAAFDHVQRPMQLLELEYSFRSAPAILRAVDATFAGEAGAGLGQASRHLAFHDTRPGRVDLWPPVSAPDKPEEAPWEDPVDQLTPDAAPTRLAEEIASQIKAMLDPAQGASIVTSKGERRLRADDILILVQRRSTLFGEIIRALKAAGLPVAGADRLKLAAELAVRDIRALLNFLATPEDDLSLAALLRSPLIGLDEDALYRLAHGRKPRETLWQRLRGSDHIEARALLSDMIDMSRLRPFDLISRMLNRHQGREKLLARLGAEAEDGIDELLSQALAYERTELPSLTGFLVWLSADDVEVRRQPGQASGLIRVMTVHGAKGLESPVVILPETQPRRPHRPELSRLRDGPTLLPGRAGERPDFAEEALAEAARLSAEEQRRLLYVAMTRAESWLIIACAGEPAPGDGSWYSLIAEGLAQSGLEESSLPGGLGEVRRFSQGDWPDIARTDTTPEDAPPASPPDAPWLWTEPAPIELPPRPVAASGLGGAKSLPGAVGDEPEEAMAFGTRLHLLLEHLPHHPREEWPARARDLLSGSEGGLPDGWELDALLGEAVAVLDAPALAELFDLPGDAVVLNEVALSAQLPGIGMLHGAVDRLIVTPDLITVIDYKSNATVPASPETVPEGLLRQMAAYRAALRGIYPGRRIETALLWTASRSLMRLPDALLDGVMGALDPSPRDT